MNRPSSPAEGGMSAAAEIARITAETIDRIEANRANLVAMYGTGRARRAPRLHARPPQPSGRDGQADDANRKGMTVNLYALIPDYAPGNEVEFLLAESDAAALEHGVFTASMDACGSYGSPTASVYLIAAGVTKIGTAHATDAPRDWEWAHPAVEKNLARLGADEADATTTERTAT